MKLSSHPNRILRSLLWGVGIALFAQSCNVRMYRRDVLIALSSSLDLAAMPSELRGGSPYLITFDLEGQVAAEIQYAADGVTYSTLSALAPSDSSYLWNVPSVDAAAARLRLRTVDGAGVVKFAESSVFEVDATTPTMPSLAITNAAITGTSTLSLNWGAPTSAFDEYCLNLNDSAIANCTWIASTSLPASIAASGDGAQTLSAWLRDSAGNVSAVVTSNSVTVDETAPAVSLTSLNGGQAIYTSTAANITWTATDTNFGATPVELSYSSDGGATWTAIATVAATASPYAWTTPATAGGYRVRVTATDAASPANATSRSSTTDFIVGTKDLFWGVQDWAEFGIWNMGAVSLGQRSAEQWVHFVHADAIALTGCSAPTLTNSTDFTIVQDDCLAANTPSFDTCRVRIRAQPASTGVKTTQLNRVCTSAGTTSVTITARGVAASAPVEVVGGENHTCARYADGTVRCWGNGGMTGELTSDDRTAPLLVSISGVTQLSAGGGSTCALLSDQTVKCWGAGNLGQMGDGSTASRFTPNQIPSASLSGVTQIAVGQNHACALLTDQTVKCWGSNLFGQLGDGTMTQRNSPTQIPSGVLSGVAQIAAGGLSSCALLTDGTVKCWGSNNTGQLGDGTTTTRSTPTLIPGASLSGVAEIRLGFGHTCARLTDGTMKCWGSNYRGQVGDGSTTDRLTPVPIAISDVAQISMGFAYSCARLGDQTLKCWGNNARTQLGEETPLYRSTPTAVSPTQISGVVSLGAAHHHACAVLNDGTIRCWGWNEDGQLGGGTSMESRIAKPVPLTHLSNVSQIAAVSSSACALISDGTVKCWGSGTLGMGAATSAAILPTTVPTLAGVTQIVSGGSHFCVLLSDGTVKCWGQGSQGQLGSGSTGNLDVPTLIPSGTLSGVTQISAGSSHTCALLSDQTVKCWGRNFNGQIGINSNVNQPSPVLIPSASLSGVTQISAGGDSVCALLSDGTVKCWGANSQRQLGDGTTTDRWVPTAIPSGSLSGVTQIQVVGNHACAVLTDQTVKCWGMNSGYNLGIGNNAAQTGIVQIPSWALSGVVQLLKRTCAVTSAGLLKCWGSGLWGEGGSTTRPYPHQMPHLTNVVGGAVGHWFVIHADGSVSSYSVGQEFMLAQGSDGIVRVSGM